MTTFEVLYLVGAAVAAASMAATTAGAAVGSAASGVKAVWTSSDGSCNTP